MAAGLVKGLTLQLGVLVIALSSGACGSSDEAAAGGGGSAGAGATEQSGGGGGGVSGSNGVLPNLSSGGGGASAADPQPSNDCSFMDLDPCVDAAVVEALGCLAADRTGTFAADRLSCSFEGAGAEVRFAEPVPSGSNGFRLSFELLVGGDECARYRDAVVFDELAPLELDTEHHSVRFMPGRERTLECDGVSKTFTTDDVSACQAGRMQSPELSKDTTVTGAADVFFYRVGMDYVFRCSSAE